MQDRIAVVGGGLAGLTLALALGRSGRSTTLVDAEPDRTDARTTAMLGPTIDLLRDLGVWDRIAEDCAPLRTMRIVDGSRRLVRAPTVTFEAAEIGQSEFGFNVPNDRATAALRDLIDADDSIRRVEARVHAVRVDEDKAMVVLGDGQELPHGLVVGADGSRSRVREGANIGVRQWTYPQAAVVTTFAHRMPHRDISTEFHTEHGPVTQVPLPGDRSSLVWVTEPNRAAELARMERSDLSARIGERLAHILGDVEVDGPVAAMPMKGQLANACTGRRVALVGEAAHAFPPIGAQGFNLTGRDIADLVSVQRDTADPGASHVTEAYERLRGRDAAVRTFFVDALNRSLLTSLLPAQLAKAGGLAVLKASPQLRRLVMREGFSPSRVSSLTATNVVAEGVARARRAFTSSG